MKKLIVIMCLLGLLLGCAGQQTKTDTKDPGWWWQQVEDYQVIEGVIDILVTDGVPID